MQISAILRLRPSTLSLSAAVLLASWCSGCTSQTAPPPDEAPADSHAAHPTEGPRGGGLIELGNEEFHGELIHEDSSGRVSIYLLDGAAKQGVPIAADQLTVNVAADGGAQQFALAAAPLQDDPEGQASRFSSIDEKLSEQLDQEGAEAQLVVEINGKQYRGEIQHEHDHDHDRNEGHEAGDDERP